MKKVFTTFVSFVLFVFVLSVLTTFNLSADSEIVVNEESGQAYNEGLKCFREDKYSQAIEHFEKACQFDDRNVNALFAQGLAYNKLKKYKEAAEKFKIVLQKNPEHVKALKMLPVSLANSGEIENALNAYDRGIAAMPESYYFYGGKGSLYSKLKEYKKAIPLLEKAVQIDPKRVNLQENLMYAYNESGNLEESYKVALQIIEMNNKHGMAQLIIADYKRINGQYSEALENYKSAARNIETKAYAEHYIEVIQQKLEEIEIEKEYEARQKDSILKK